MPEAQTTQALRPCAYHVVRYTPNLVRDEWVNIGILLFDPASGRLLQRLLAEDWEAELERLYHDHVEVPRQGRLADGASRNGIRARATQVFRGTGIWPRLERRLRVDEFTYAGDPLRLDYGYRRNGARGFVQALSLSQDLGQAKVLAFTADAIRQKLAHTEFVAVTETEPHPQENPRHRFVLGLLQAREISVVPLGRLAEWSYRLRPTLLGGSAN